MTSGLVLYTEAEGIGRLVLNRPERHNALVPELLDALAEALARCAAQPPRALTLAAQGKSFSSGGDVGGFYAVSRAGRRAYAELVVGALNSIIVQLLQLPCPTVAAVHGMVTGGSVGLMLACDIAVGGPHTHIAPWYTVVGYSPDGGWTALMPERIGRARALQVQLLNRRIDADEATHLGLLQQLAPDTPGVQALANEVATQLCAAKPGSVRHTLALMRPDPARVAAGLAAELQHFVEQIDTDEAERGMADFLGVAGA